MFPEKREGHEQSDATLIVLTVMLVNTPVFWAMAFRRLVYSTSVLEETAISIFRFFDYLENDGCNPLKSAGMYTPNYMASEILIFFR